MFKPLWNPGRLSQKGDWPDLLNSFNFTEKQVKTLLAILDYFRKKGHPLDYYDLTKHMNSSQTWQNKFVSTAALREFFETLAKTGVCSYRYAWEALNCLIHSGFIEANVTATIRGRKTRGYCFSDRALRYFHKVTRMIPKLWEKSR
jgi:hypothetical protein